MSSLSSNRLSSPKGSGQAFSAAEIASAVGVTARAVRGALVGIPETGRSTRGGNETPVYSVEALPDRIRQKIGQQQTALHYRSPEAVLASPKRQWQPAVPLSAQPASSVEYAHSLRRALAYYIARRNDASISRADLLSRTAADWLAAFRKPAQRRHIERMADLVLSRDNGREEFDRLEIYLPAADPKVAQSAPRVQGQCSALADAVQTIEDVGNLSIADKGYLWRATFSDFETLISEGTKENRAKRIVLEFLLGNVPSIAISRPALWQKFDRKLEKYEAEGVRGLRDRRKEEGERRRKRRSYDGPDSLTEDERLLLGRANSIGGGLSQAFRDLYLGVEIVPGTKLQFSAEFLAAYSFDPRTNKSYVPQILRDKLQPLLASIAPHRQGPKAARHSDPSNHRDWSKVLAGAWYQSDDETGNHYIWMEAGDGIYEYQGLRFDVFRPQILPLVDVRTDYVLSILLLGQAQYNSRAIRSLILRTCMDERIGLPFEGFYFENGIWKSRKVQALVKWTEIDDAFAQSGLNLRIRHATTPRAKIIERIFSQEQNSMQELPGYAGRDERKDCPERTRAALASLKRVGQPLKAEVDPRRHFLSAEKYMELLKGCYERFNHEPQNGKRLQGRSPAQAWKEFSGGRPHMVLPDSLRYLLATEKADRPLTVTTEGICLRFGKVRRYFFESEKLGMLVGEKVEVRWNQDFPDQIVVVHRKSDPHAQNPFVVGCDPELDAMAATGDDLEEARRSRRVFTQPQRTLFQLLDHQYGRTVRNETLGSDSQRATGAAHNAVESKHVAQSEEKKQATHTARRMAHRAGFDSTKIKDSRRAVEELEGLPELEARLLLEEQNEHR